MNSYIYEVELNGIPLIFKKPYIFQWKSIDFQEKTIFLARFVPIIRTYAPFVAGIAKMNYRRFIFYNVFGGGVWIFSFLLLGFYFGNIPTVKENLSSFILLIIFISVTPGIFIFIKNKIFTKY